MTKEDWMSRKWRPAMGWVYMVTCITDFILFPILWAMFQAYLGETVTPWEPLTLQGAGLFHVAMGAVLGVTAWTRSKEKMAGVPPHNNYYEEGYVEEYATSHPRFTRSLLRRPRQPRQPEL